MKDDYKEAQAAIRDLKAGNIRGIETAIHFLKADVYEHRSGYLKEYIWRYLLRVPLTERQAERLLQVARKYLQRRMTREFRSMCRLANRIADKEFRESIRALADSASDKEVSARAKLLSAYLTSLSDGERMRIPLQPR
jgi:two-component SAPR family response regulator